MRPFKRWALKCRRCLFKSLTRLNRIDAYCLLAAGLFSNNRQVYTAIPWAQNSSDQLIVLPELSMVRNLLRSATVKKRLVTLIRITATYQVLMQTEFYCSQVSAKGHRIDDQGLNFNWYQTQTTTLRARNIRVHRHRNLLLPRRSIEDRESMSGLVLFLRLTSKDMNRYPQLHENIKRISRCWASTPYI